MRLAVKWRAPVCGRALARWSPRGGLLALICESLDRRDNYMVAAYSEQGIALWRQEFYSVVDAAFSPDGRRLGVLREGGELEILDAESGARQKTVDLSRFMWQHKLGTVFDAASVSWSSGGVIGGVSYDDKVLFVEAKPGGSGGSEEVFRALWAWRVETSASSGGTGVPLLRFSPADANLAAVGTRSGELIYVNLASKSIQRIPATVRFLEWSPDGRWLVVGGSETLRLYDSHGRIAGSAAVSADAAVWISEDALLVSGAAFTVYSLKGDSLRPVRHTVARAPRCDCAEGVAHMAYSRADKALAVVYRIERFGRLCVYSLDGTVAS
ncbi:WD40 repeat domain-containing protein [Pyrobaculum neutrophilum]|uniref:WD-40 repeat protein n=1 Tax=Pyrobaculum neutrophilum (strain DSM 2338 / JCM 9278 / NBRC 100436 / V24Sta) TaxID=444157 RepID=B1YBZ6_PYRNV|nr:WD40 repeat domain-containing protein [Pyrobaculum neutrophilum]ACB39380.1 hypothetical protein Tneu_0432 [Pyrobaculum neutrophilum V24Sta]